MRKSNLMLVHDSGAPPLTPEQLSDRSGEPRVVDLTLAKRLGFSRGREREIRRLIERNRIELQSYGEVCVAVTQTSEAGGRPGKEYWLNEGQALVLCALSRTPQAAAVRKQVIEVFLAYRRGKLATVPAPDAAGAIPTEAKAGLDALRQNARTLAEAATALLARVDQHEREMQATARKAAKRLAAPAPAAAAPVDRGPMLMGLVAIAAHLGVTPRQAKYRSDIGAIPTFKMGRAVCSSREALDTFVAERLSNGRCA